MAEQSRVSSTFNVMDAVSYGWAKTSEVFWTLLPVIILYFILQMLPNMVVTTLRSGHHDLFADVIDILGLILNFIISFGLLHVVLNVYDKKSIRWDDLFSHNAGLLNYVLGTIAVSLIVLAGLILLVIPGIVLGIRLQYVTFLVADKQMNPGEAIKTSWNMTRGNFWKLFGFTLLAILIMIAGLLVFGVGILFAMPVVLLANVYIYRHLWANPTEEVS